MLIFPGPSIGSGVLGTIDIVIDVDIDIGTHQPVALALLWESTLCTLAQRSGINSRWSRLVTGLSSEYV